MADEHTNEKRRHPRHRIAKTVRATIAGKKVEVESLNISASGIALGLGGADDLEIDTDEYLRIDIEDVGELAGQVARSFDAGVGVRFVDIDEQEEEMLIADLEQLSDTIQSETE